MSCHSLFRLLRRSKNEEANLIKAIIQRECTSIHDSVLWRFEQEAKNYIKNQFNGKDAIFKKIAFDKIYPLYGQIDIQGIIGWPEIRRHRQDLNLAIESCAQGYCRPRQIKLINHYRSTNRFVYQIDKYLGKLSLNSNFRWIANARYLNSFIQEIDTSVLSS